MFEILQTDCNGHFGERKATQIKGLARDSFGIPDCEDAYSTLLLMYLGQLQSLQDAATALEKRIVARLSQFDSTLTSITGISPVLGAVILSEIRDISCFASADKLVAFAGLNPKVKQSGNKKSSAVHMSKRSSPYLRGAIWMAGTIAVQYTPMFRAYYEKNSAEGLRYMNIIGYVSKKMTVVIFVVMRDNKIYERVLLTA